MNTSIIVVPYRNREEHLSLFMAHMQKRYNSMPICVVEQEDGKAFNRAKLLNIGYLQNYKQYHNFIFHDVDMLPISVNYTIKYNVPIVQLASSKVQIFDYLGGVTRFSRNTFEKCGGYNNEYYHRAEDNEMMFNIKRLGMNVIRKPGTYVNLEHERKGPEFDPALWEKAQRPREIQNQLRCCQYKISNVTQIGNVTHIIVSI